MSDFEVVPEDNSNLDPPKKKKRRRLSIKERILIIDRLAAGESNTSLAQEFGVSSAAISKINKNIENIINYKNATDSNLTRKKLTNIENTTFEKVIYMWYKQRRCLGEAVPGPLLREKALELNAKMNGPKSFRASTGWVHRFKERHSIRYIPFNAPALDDETAIKFCENFMKFVEDYNINPNNIYNADETVLGWKSIPKERSHYKRRNAVHSNEDKVTTMVCCNATGTHKLPLLVIGTEEMPECLKDQQLSVMYTGQKEGRMNEEIFLKWYTELFLPELREKHVNDNEKCILLIDYAPPHPSVDFLNEEDDICEVQTLPSDVTTYLQPLNQGIIRKMKTVYKTSLITDLLAKEPLDIDKFCDGLTLKNCCDYLANSWNCVTEEDVKNAWQKVIKREEDQVRYEDETYIPDLLVMLRKIPCCSRFTLHSTRDWIEEDNCDPGWTVLSDDQIINEVITKHVETKQVVRTLKDKKIINHIKKRARRMKNASKEASPKPFGSEVLIKKEVDENVEKMTNDYVGSSDECEIKHEAIDEEAMDMQRNVFFFQECSSDMQHEEEEDYDDDDDEEKPVEVKIENRGLEDERLLVSDAIEKLPRRNQNSTNDKNHGIPSAYDAMTSIDTVYKWFERKEECSPQDLIRLRQMREIARKEILVTVNKP